MCFHGVERLLAEQTVSEEKQPSGAGVWAWNHAMLSLNAPLEASAACGISFCTPEHTRLDHVLLTLTSLRCGVWAKQPDRYSRQKTYDTEIDGGTNSFTECPKIQSQTTFIQSNLCAVQLQRWRHTHWLTSILMILLHCIMALLQNKMSKEHGIMHRNLIWYNT